MSDKKKPSNLACSDPGGHMRRDIETLIEGYDDLTVSAFVRLAIEDKILLIKELNEVTESEPVARVRVSGRPQHMGAV